MHNLLTVTLLSIALVVSNNAMAADLLAITGRIVNDADQPISDVRVTIEDLSVLTDKQGKYLIKPTPSKIYQVKFTKKNYYPSIQTFSHHELTSSSQDSLADITLVAKTKNRVMLAFGGDVMMGRRFYQPYFGDSVLIHPDKKLLDSKAVVENIKPYMSLADYAAVNLETQVADNTPDERAPKSVTFYSQPEVLDALTWAGVDYVSLGNNHTYDYMDSGLHSTLAFLTKSELGFSGAGINEQQALQAHHQRINSTDFSMLGYVGWEGSVNPSQTATQTHGGAAYGSMANILTSVSREVKQDKVTIVQYHGSQEYADNPTGVTEQRLKSSLDAGASLAIAHHPHVTQGLELYNGKLIAYSMGNFVFDQNFSATQHSFILYVWLDGDKFHRAEIVPLYVKGYKPTPATGMHRYTVMKRLTELSKTRDTVIHQSGGHGVITADNSKSTLASFETELFFADNEKAVNLYQQPWQQQLSQIVLPQNDLKYRLGTNLVNGSDFESFNTFDSPERGWLFDREITALNQYGVSGQHSLALSLKTQNPTLFGMQSFKRVFTASQPMTVKAKINTKKAVTARFYWQGRKKRQKLFDAFESSPKNLIQTVELTGQDSWQNIEVDFNSPRIGYKSYRVLVEFELLEGSSSQLDIDDFSVIEWQTAFTDKISPQLFTIKSQQPAFIGLNKQTDKPLTLTFK